MTYKDEWAAGRPPYQHQPRPGAMPPQGPRIPDENRSAVYGTPPGGYAPPPAPKRKRKLWPWVLIVAAVLAFASCAALISSATPDYPPTPTSLPPAAAIEGGPSASSTSPAGASGQDAVNQDKPSGTSFPDGEWLVGKGREVVPGIYRTPGAQSTPGFCAAIIEKNNTPVDSASSQNENAPARITLREGQTVNSTGCQTWQKVG